MTPFTRDIVVVRRMSLKNAPWRIELLFALRHKSKSSSVERFRSPAITMVDLLIASKQWDQIINLISHDFDGEPSSSGLFEKRSLLHKICASNDAPLSLVNMVAAMNPRAITIPDDDVVLRPIPLHNVCKNSLFSEEKLKILLKYVESPNEAVLIKDLYHQTTLHYACSHCAPLGVIKELVKANPELIHRKTKNGFHCLRILWDCYMSRDSPEHVVFVERLLRGENVEIEEHFERFWEKMVFLATLVFAQSPHCPNKSKDIQDFTLHGLLHCDGHVDQLMLVCIRAKPSLLYVPDNNGDLPLHVLLKKQLSPRRTSILIEQFLRQYPEAAAMSNASGALPLHLAIQNNIRLESGFQMILDAAPLAVSHRDPYTGFFPYQLAAFVGGDEATDVVFILLSLQPDLCTLRRTPKSRRPTRFARAA